MEINEFAQKMCNAIKKELGEGYELEIKEVIKNNGVVLHGLLIRDMSRNVIPTIYLESFWEAYEEGMPFGVVLRRLLEVYRADTPKSKVNMEFFKYFEQVKDRICFRLVKRKGNEKMLENVPYLEFLDLAICFFYAYRGEIIGDGSILIHHSHLDMWHTKVEELYKLALKNTPRLYPWESSTMEAVLDEDTCFSFDEEERIFLRKMRMKVLSNERKIQGAACILYPGVLDKLSRGESKGFFILPSSVHEVILLQDTGEQDLRGLKEMVQEVNASMVAPEEVLSDSIYYYDVREKKIHLIF